MNISLIVDIGVVAVILISAGVSFFRGFIREVLTILGVVGGGFASLSFGGLLVPLFAGWLGVEKGHEKDAGKLFDLIPMELVAQIGGYASVFLLIFILLQLASYFISKTVEAVGLGPVDRTLGVFFGIARGLLLLGILYLPFNFVLSDENKKSWFDSSKTMVFIEGVTDWMTSFVPQDKAATVTDETREKLKAIDILGDKKITSPVNAESAPNSKDSAEKSSPENGYSEKARQGLDKLIQNATPPKGSFNE